MISDTHERHAAIDVPEGDVLICAGDVTANGNPAALERFARWMSQQPHAHKILVAGNHDWCFERNGRALLPPDIIYLQDSATAIDGLRIWGSPWQPRFCDWAFNLDRGPQLAAKWALIPADTDILVTHGPPFGTLDLTPRGDRAGCEALAARLEHLPRVRLHVFGHIHHGYGVVERDGRISVNASICDESYRATNAPVVIDLECLASEGTNGASSGRRCR
jgi:predicted phosphohydrolase